MDFKADKEKQKNAFSTIAASKFKEIEHNFDIVVRALGLDETTAQKPNRVRDIAIAIHKVVKAKYDPTLLSKTRVTKPLKPLKKYERIAELEDVYRLSEEVDLNNKNILVIDDISTTGTTLMVIGQLIKSKYPDAILYGFILAKTHSRYDISVTKNSEALEKEYRDLLKQV